MSKGEKLHKYLKDKQITQDLFDHLTEVCRKGTMKYLGVSSKSDLIKMSKSLAY